MIFVASRASELHGLNDDGNHHVILLTHIQLYIFSTVSFYFYFFIEWCTAMEQSLSLQQLLSVYTLLCFNKHTEI